MLDVNLRPMVLAPDAATTLNPDGTLLQNGQPVAQLRLARIDDLQQLTKAGHNAFTFHGPNTPPVADDVHLQVGALESSAVNPITTLIQVTDATKAATANANLIKYHDTLMDGAINTLGRVA